MAHGIVKHDFGDGQYIVEMIKDIEEAQRKISRIQRIIDQMDAANNALQIEAYQKKIDEFQEFINNANPEIVAWQADIPDDDNPNKLKIGSHVGLCIIGDDTQNSGINIRPGFTDAAAYDVTRDGRLKNMALLHPMSWFIAICIQPGVRKFKPRYRYGTITKLDSDSGTCDLTVGSVESFWRLDGGTWNLDLSDYHVGVDIDYMDCIGVDPFEVGDNVLIEYTDADPEEPKVIGYKDNPQPCGTDELVYVRFGNFGFVWDVTEDTYAEGLVGIKSISQCVAYLTGNEELTIDDIPYKRMLNRYYNTADYSDFNYDYVILGGKNLGTTDACGELLTFPELSRVEVIDGLTKTVTITFGPATCILGELQAGFTAVITYTWNELYYELQGVVGNTQNHIGIVEDVFVQLNIKCPLDSEFEYYSQCTAAEYGNDPIAIGNNALRYSQRDENGTYKGTIVQVFFNVRTVYLGSPDWAVHAAVDSYPFDDGLGGETSDPMDQERHTNFSDTVDDLIQEQYDFDPTNMLTPLVSGGGCSPASKPYYYYYTYPLFEVKIYRK